MIPCNRIYGVRFTEQRKPYCRCGRKHQDQPGNQRIGNHQPTDRSVALRQQRTHTARQMPVIQKQRCWNCLQFSRRARHDEKCLDIGPRGCGQRHHLGIHELFTVEFRMGLQHPYRGVAPEQSRDDFFKESDQPVVPSHMDQFVTGDTELRVMVQGKEGFGKQYHRIHMPQRGRTIHIS